MDDDVIDVSDRTEFIRRMRSARKDYDNPCIYCTRICIETKCDKYNEWVDSMRKRQSSRQNAPQHA